MLNRFFISGVFSGILSVICLTKIIDFTSGVEKESNVEKKGASPMVRFSKAEKKSDDSLLSQCNSRFEVVVEQYKKMTLAEIHEEVGKIEKEKKGDVTGSALEAVALDILFLQWKKLEPMGFDNYRTESDSGAAYYFNNPALKAKSWAELIVQIWTERDPVSASQYVCERWDEQNRAGANPDKLKERNTSEKEFDFEAIIQRVAYAMGRHSAETALEWAEKMSRISSRLPYYVLQSLISNHPEKVAGLFSHMEDISFPPREKELCLRELVRQWRKAAPETADQWLTSYSAEKTDSLSDIFRKEKSMDRLSDAIRYYEEADEKDRKELKVSIVEQFAQKDPASILDWMLKSSNGNEPSDWMSKLTPRSEHAFQNLKKYLTKMPPGVKRWQMVRIIESGAYDGYATVDDMIEFTKLSLETNELSPKEMDEAITSWIIMFPWKRVVQTLRESNLSPELKRKYIEKSPSLMDMRPE